MAPIGAIAEIAEQLRAVAGEVDDGHIALVIVAVPQSLGLTQHHDFLESLGDMRAQDICGSVRRRDGLPVVMRGVVVRCGGPIGDHDCADAFQQGIQYRQCFGVVLPDDAPEPSGALAELVDLCHIAGRRLAH